MGCFHDPDEEVEAARRLDAVCRRAVHEWINDLIRSEFAGDDDTPWVEVEAEAFLAADLAFQRLPMRRQLMYQNMAEEALFDDPDDDAKLF